MLQQSSFGIRLSSPVCRLREGTWHCTHRCRQARATIQKRADCTSSAGQFWCRLAFTATCSAWAEAGERFKIAWCAIKSQASWAIAMYADSGPAVSSPSIQCRNSSCTTRRARRSWRRFNTGCTNLGCDLSFGAKNPKFLMANLSGRCSRVNSIRTRELSKCRGATKMTLR
jgi:hypothetical protein